MNLPDTPCVVRARIFAHSLSMRYFGCPVYLVGGALYDYDPRDVDLVVPLPNDVFLACYGSRHDKIEAWGNGWATADPTPLWMRWARDCAKQSLELTRFCERAVDFKTQPQSFFDTLASKPRLRLSLDLRMDAGTPKETPP